jgi:hypothetical protein
MNYSRGDVVLVLFPDSNLRTAKRRPAIIVQAHDLGTGLPQTIVANGQQQPIIVSRGTAQRAPNRFGRHDGQYRHRVP